MAREPLHTLKLQELQRALHTCAPHDRQRHVLRRECLRRAQAWGQLANCAGVMILVCLAVILIHLFTH